MRATRLDEAIFDELAAASGSNLISAFLPTHKKGRDVAQDRIRLKNQLAKADETMAELGWRPRQRSDRLAKARSLLDDLGFWQHQEAGLALYVDEHGDITPVATARPLNTSCLVLPVYVLRPLAAELNGLVLPVLALTKDEAALFTASELGADELSVELPSYEDVNWFVDREKERQQHPDRVGAEGSRHGHEPSARRDDDLARFLREVDAAIGAFDEKAPLVVLGDDDLVSRFTQVSGRSTVSPPNSGIRAPFSSHEIADEVGSLIADMERNRIDEAVAIANDQLGTGMATLNIADAIPAALSGRVERVLVDRIAPAIWGRVDEKSMQVEIHEIREFGDVDLLDRLVVWAQGNGAEIVSVETMPNDRTFVATYRF